MATKSKPRPSAKAPVAAARTSSASPARTRAVTAKPAARAAVKPAPKSAAKPAVKPAVKSASRPAPKPISVVVANELPRTPPATNEEFVLHIRLIGQRLDEHVGFMCEAEKMCGTSAEAKQKALSQFYARLTSFEQELGRIREELQLG